MFNDNKKYFGMLDQKAVFHAVWHDGLFVKLGRLGILVNLLRTLISSYNGLKCVIKMNGRIYEQFAIGRYVRQTGVLDPIFTT